MGGIMIELWGADDCPACVQARNLLSRTPIEFRYVDVATISFEGEIPRIILENREQIIGLPAIKNYITQWLRNQGFPEGMI